MTEAPDTDILQRKAQAGTRDYQARTMSVPKALRLSVAKVANDLFSLVLSVIGATKLQLNAADCIAEFDDEALLILLDGPEQAIGAAIITPSLVAALVQHQTTGQVSEAKPTPRPMTATDGALCAPLLDAVLARAAHLLETDKDRQVLSGYRYGARPANARLLQMALNDDAYHVIRLTLDIAGGVQQGMLTLVLPVPGEKNCDTVDGADDQQDNAGSKMTLNDTVLSLHADLSAVLCRIRLPVSQLGQLKAGDALDVPMDAFQHAQVATSTGTVLATEILGQRGGVRAIRLDQSDAGSVRVPQRRASDRATLDMPAVTSHPSGRADPSDNLPRLDDLPPALSGADPADFSDLPELSGPQDASSQMDLKDVAVA